MNGIVFLIDYIAAAVLLVLSFHGAYKMDWDTKHCYRMVNVAVGVSALAIVACPIVGGELRNEWWTNAHAALVVCVAFRALIGRRTSDRIGT